MRAKLSQVWLVSSRELRDQLRDWRILFPLLILSLFFPILMRMTAQAIMNFVKQYDAAIIAEHLVPFLMMLVGFFPITVGLVVALEAFVGEKERGTIEPLLSSPLLDWQLYLGKLIASTVVPLLAAYLAISVYLVSLVYSEIRLPETQIVLQTLVLTTVQGILMISGAMVISAQSTTVRAANLLASFVILPVALMVQGESVLMFWGNSQTLWLAVIALGILSALLVRLGLAHFKRESLIGREIDMLNVGWMSSVFLQRFMGKNSSVVGWVFREVPGTVWRMRRSVLVTLGIGIIAVIAAFEWTTTYVPDLMTAYDHTQMETLTQEVKQALDIENIDISAVWIFTQNIRAVIVSAILGFVSFSILGMMAFLVNAGLIGGVLGLAGMIGYSPIGVFVVGVLPHGIFELTAVIISTAALLHMGVTLVTPDSDHTIAQVFIESCADWAKIFIGLVFPLLVIAALVETYVTPQIIAYFV